jgi:hypothetical protein
MATKKKSKKKQAKRRKVAPTKKSARKKLAKKRVTRRKKSAKKAVPKRGAAKLKARGNKTTAVKAAGARRKKVGGKSQSSSRLTSAREGLRARSGGQSGDLQGLSRIEDVDSESVGELIEEGNAFEADVVKGVEDAGDAEGGEVRTHEVPEDDVPGEYLDKE